MFSGAISFNIFAQSAGFNNTFAILSINGGANTYYDLNANTANTDFNNADLGTFVPGTNTLTLRGAEHNVYKCGASDLTSTRLMYRIYSTSGSGGAFSSINVPWTSGFNNGCGGQDQQWSLTGHNLNILTGLAPGSYFLEVYSEATVTNCCGGMVYAGNGGANYKATFTVGGSPIVVTATTGNVGPTVYATLKAAFDAINSGTHTGSITINVTGNTTETATAALNASGSGLASYSAILIQPNGGAARTISGAITAGSSLINLNGADNATFNGLNTGGNSLTISNTTASATSGTSTLLFVGDATNNTITNCSVLGSHSAAVGTNGAVIFFSTGTTTGNDNNTISNCNIGPAGSNLPTKAILGNGSTGSTAAGNSGITINNNNIFDYFGAAVSSSGVAINGGCNAWSITNNRFYQTGTRTWTTGSTHRAIDLNSTTATSGVRGMTVTGNIIGFSSNTQTGTYTLTGSNGKFQGIFFNGITGGTISNINSNTIASVSLTGVTSSGSTSSAVPFAAISIASGLVTTNSNTIGSQSSATSLNFSTTTTSTTWVFAMYNVGSDDWQCNNNIIGGITATNLQTGTLGPIVFYGIRNNTVSVKTFTCSGNTIGGTSAGNISITTPVTSTSAFAQGIVNNVASGNISGNIIRNITTNVLGSTTLGASLIGICVTTTGENQTVSQNQIYGLNNTNTTASTTVTGIQFTGSTANIVERNFIYGLTSATTSASAEINGIRVAGGTTTYRNNMIAIGAGISNAIGAAASNSGQTGINGINEALGTNNFWHNSIYIGGTATAGLGASYAFNGIQTTNTRSFRNNLFVNARTNSGATGKNYAIKINGTAANPTGLTINNNVYFTSGTGGVFGYFNSVDVSNLASWKIAVGQDAASLEGNPQFTDPTNSTPDLHINGNNSTNAEAVGFDMGITTDFDGQTRSSLTPVDIGADAFIALVTCASTPSPTSGTIDVVLSPTLSWAAATNATGYDVYLGTTSGSLTLVSTNQAGLSYTPSTALNPSTQYYWRIVPRNGSNFATGCSEWFFTTQAASPTLSATSLSAFANQCVNTTSAANSFNLSGVYLTTADITVGPLSGFAFSATSNGTYSSTLIISQSGGTLASSPVFVQFTPTSVASFNGNIPVSGGGLSTPITVAAVGSGVNTAATASTGVSSAITGTSATLAGAFVANCQTITAYGIEYSTTNGFANGSGTQVPSTNQSSGSFTSSLTGLNALSTTYYYKAYATYGAITVYGAQSSFTTLCGTASIPWTEGFENVTTGTTVVGTSSSLPNCWLSESTKWSTSSAVTYNTSNSGSKYLRYIYSTTNAFVWTPGFNLTAGIPYEFSFYAQGDGWTGWNNDVFVNSSQSSVGATQITPTYSPSGTNVTAIQSYNLVTRSFTPSSTGVYYFGIRGNQASGSPWYMAFDDFSLKAPCSSPTNQPTNLTFTNVGPAQMTVNYTASTSSPSGYMIVRYPAGDTPTLPVNGTTYTAGTSLGTGTVAYVGSGLSNVISGLTVNTNYDFYVYAYNAVTCTNGPVYNTNSPLSGTQSTTGCPALSSIITIGPGFDYATLTDAIVILNGCGITQPTTLELQGNYVSTSEAFPISLGAISGANAINTITIRPASNVASDLTISSSNATGTISHNGGNYFIIDGRPGGTGTSKFITVENTSNSGYAVNYLNEASNNILRYSTIKGQNTSTTSGTIVFSSTTGANGNDNNTVEYNDICAINASTATPTNGIYAAGSTTTSIANNSNNSISNNTIRDFYNSSSTSNGGSGINIITGNTDWVISNNSIFQTQSRTTYGAGAPVYAIFINNTAGNNFTVSSNTIGGTSVNAGGTAMTINASTTALMRLIYISVGVTTSSSISNNIVKNISFTTTSASSVNGLISILNGAVNCSNNVLGDASISNSIVFNTSGAGAMFSGIGAGTGTTGQGLITLSGNTIAGIAVGGGGTCELRAITFQSSGITASTQYTVSNNTIGSSAITNSLSNSNNSAVYGIIGTANQTTSANTLSGNTIAGIQSTSSAANASVYGILAQGNLGGRYNTSGNSIFKLQSSGGSIVSGIYHTAATTTDQIITSNIVNELSYTGTATSSVLGIFYSGPTTGTNEIRSNLVHSLSASTLGSTLTGIQVADAGNALIYNNMIRLGINAAGSAVTTNAIVHGINQSGSTSNHSFYFNSIYIGGAGVVTGTNNTFALHSAATSGTRNIRNNIFSNERGNGAGTGKHFAVRLVGLTGLTINNNDYWTGASFLAQNNTTDVTSFTAWQTATSQDAGSLSNDPNFINATGNATSLDLHINNSTSSVLESGGVNIPGITSDRDGDPRPGPAGSANGGGISSDIGADEFDGIPGYTCSTFPALTATTNNATVCGGSSATLSISGTISGTGVTYQWQSASTQTGTYTNIVGATGATYVVPVSSVSNLWYICQVTCANGPVTTATSAVNVQVLACNYTTSRNTGISFNSIMTTGSTYTSLNGTTPADDGYTNVVSLAGTTFKYRGSAVTGFVATTNGWMTFNTSSTNSTFTNDLTSSANTNVLAPLWEDLVIRGTNLINKDVSMRYQVVGTLGSGTADIIIEWAEMERFNYGDPNVNFQVVLHESDNSIDYNYGNFQMFNGATNGTAWTYSIGMNGPTPATVSTDQRIILQAENSNFFNSSLQNSLGYSIECNSQFRFVPSTTFSSGSAPTSGSFTASAFAPANNETAGAITLSVNGSPCTSNCGNIYSSKNATSTNGITACTATTPGAADDDVFFKFTTSSLTNYRIAVDPSAGYNAVVQVLDASLNPVTCVNAAGAGLSELITSLTLNASSLYYIRIYDAATGAANNGEFAICVSEVIAPPANDEPAGAITLTTGVSCSATSSILPATLSATATTGVSTCTAGTPGNADDDIWYTFTTNSIAGTTYSITATGVSTYNAVLQLYSGTVGNLTSVNCVNSTGNGGVETINAGALTTNTTYYLRVYHSGTGAANGNVSICVVHTLPACLTAITTASNEYVWQGQTTDWNASSNWLIYNGPSSYGVAYSAPTNVNVIIPSATCFSNQPVVLVTPSTINNLTILSGASLSLGGNILSLTGNLNVAGTFTPGTGTVDFIGTGTQVVTMGNQSFNNVTINGANLPNITPTVQLSANTTINGDYTNNSGSLDLNTFNLTIGGNYSNYVASTGTANGLVPNGGSVIFNNSTGTQTLYQETVDFFSLQHTGAGTLQLLSDISTTGNIINSAGTFDGNGKIISTKGNFNNSATFNSGTGGQIIFEKDGGNQTLTAGSAIFGKLIHQIPVGGTSSTLTLSGIVDVKGDIVIDAPIIPGTSTVKLSGTSNQTISGSESFIPLSDMIIDKSSGLVTLSAPIRVNGTLTMNQGDIITDASNLIEIGSSATSVGSVSWVSGSVRGPMKRWFSSTPNSSQASGIFPVGVQLGTKVGTNRYAQVNFTQTSPGGYIIAEYKTGIPTNNYAGLPLNYNSGSYPQAIQNAEEEGYWDITPYSSDNVAYASLNSTPYTLKVRLQNPSTLTTGWISNANGNNLYDASTIRLIRSKGSSGHINWELAGTHSAATDAGNGDYFLTSTDITEFSWFNGGGNNQNPLPVELSYFSGICTNELVTLTWQTASEQNSSHFDIEKSTNGEIWRVIGTVSAAGNSTEEINYSFIDSEKSTGDNYYRLNQVDIDGKNEIYGPITISCGDEAKITTYPNPSKGEFNLVMHAKANEKVTLKIMDGNSRVISTKVLELQNGINLFPIRENLSSGVYDIQLISESGKSTVLKHSVY
jgi:hypothetical protein